MKQGKFSKEEIYFLINNYDKLDTNELCSRLDRNIDSVRYKASKLDLKKHDDLYYLNQLKCVLEFNNYTLLSDKYIGMKEKYEIQCNLHKVVKSVTGDCIMQNKFKCDECKSETVGTALKMNIDTVRNEFYNKNLTPIFKDADYKNDKSKLKFICNIHNNTIQQISYNSLKRCKFGCMECAILAIREQCSGENSYLWKGGLRTESKIARDSIEYKNWRTLVFERDDYTCQCCGHHGGKLEAHHIKNFSEYQDLRFDINNGITLCEKCHSSKFKGSFHNTYGTRNNTKEQLEEYIKK